MSDHLPPELIVKILLKLPVKSLIRFTTVCKSWYATITSPSFISSHLYKPKNETLFLQRYDPVAKQNYCSLLEIAGKIGPFRMISSSELELPFKCQLEKFKIVGSCRGIVCFTDNYFSCLNRPVLWNPSVKKHLVLPNGVINPSNTDDDCVLGFGVAGDSDFKVVRLVYHKSYDDRGFSSLPEVEVFSLKTGRWRRLVGHGVQLKAMKFIWTQVFLNGVVHWLGKDGGERCSVLGFRVGEEVFDEITLPYELAKEPVIALSLTLVGESLAVIKYNGDWDGCDVWLLKECGVQSYWTKWYTFSLMKGMNRVLVLRKNGEALVDSDEIGLVAFDSIIRKTENLGIQGNPFSFYVDDYVESLGLLKCESKSCKEVQGAEEDLI